MNPNDLKTLMTTQQVLIIGASQRTVAFTVVADAGNGRSNFTATGHALKKGQCVYIAAGAYAGIHRVSKVISDDIIQVDVAFVSTTTGTLLLTAALDGHGFIVNDNTSFEIASFVPLDPNVDPLTVIARDYSNNEEVPIAFKSMRLTAGDVTVIAKGKPTDLAYRQ